MLKFSANGVNLHYEVIGDGFPLVWSHEYSGGPESWDPQVKFFSRRYQVITYSSRGYPPSDVPEDPAAYSQDIVVEDLRLLLEHLGIRQAYIGGLSMGGAVALNFCIAHPWLAKAVIVAAAGSGSDSSIREKWLVDGQAMTDRLLSEGMEAVAKDYARGPARVQLLRKDPKGWQEFYEGLAAHSALGSALTYRGFMLKRPTTYSLEEKLRQLQVPALILVGDEDDLCVQPAVFMKRNIPRAGLAVFPQSGHAINLEEPDLFNRTVQDFLTAVEADRWPAWTR
ncbi:MAG: alpha/beta hydrolase [Dehalococcoidia bacterium]|jgi:pimeloyl-ACP methyl ester carboxylesterase|nr:alpha/beta hydrolase [Dehalococcoidia bacterium]